jgi:hypothetical protein
MQNQVFNKDRYPGLRSFDKSQSALFFGRELEIDELFGLVSTEKTIVFFGKSGLGKSSLLEAGLSPLLEKNGYKPVRVRFSPDNRQPNGETGMANLLLSDFLDSFKALDNQAAIVHDKDNAQLWEYIKATPFKDAEGNALTPVFIFDQFEEFFYHSKEHKEAFLKQLSEVVHDQPPRRILEWITAIPSGERTPQQMQWYKQPDVKVIFALRSDKLALMQSLAPYMPGVLRTRYELKPLNKQQAGEAIKLPGQKEMGEGYAPPFSFSEPLLNNIVNELGKGSNEIESSQLQMVCNYIESQVKEKATAETPVAEITEAIINPASDIQKIRDNFYEDQLRQKIPDAAERALAKTVIEDDLVIEGQRASLLEKQLLAKLDGKKQLIDALLQARLIREENTQRGITYEVSHDTLVAPIEKSKKKRHASEEEKQKEAERIKMEADNLKYEQENREKTEQLKKESDLRKAAERAKEEAEQQRSMAEKARAEADSQKREVEKQKELVDVQRVKAEQLGKRASHYFWVASILGILALAGGIYFFIDRQDEKKQRKIAQMERAKIDSALVRYNNISLQLLEDNLKQTAANENYIMEDTSISLAYEVAKQARSLDTGNRKIDTLIEKIYQRKARAKQITTITPIDTLPVKTIDAKIEYLNRELPKVQMKEYQQEYQNAESKGFKGKRMKKDVQQINTKEAVKTQD